MLDRMKGARSDETESSDRKRDGAIFDAGLPRFQPQPGGFGRRATPVGGQSAPPPGAAGGDPAGTPQPSFRKPDPQAHGGAGAPAQGGQAPVSPTAVEPVLGDIPTRIADWLMRELKDERGIHCETILTVAGALAGYACCAA